MRLDGRLGFIVGRFQPFHVGHLSYLKEAATLFDSLFICITNPDPSSIRREQEDDHRHRVDANIFTYYERVLMVLESLPEAEIDSERVIIVPFPIHDPGKWKYYVPLEATAFIRIFDAWDQRKVGQLSSAGYPVQSRRMTESQRDASGTLIRKLLREHGNWADLVPKGSKGIIERFYLRRTAH